MADGLTCGERVNNWLGEHIRCCPAMSDMPGAKTLGAARSIISASLGIVSTLVLTEAANIFQGALLSSSASVSSAVSAALVMPLNYSMVTVLSGAMRASQNFFKEASVFLLGSSDLNHRRLGQRWRTALLYAFVLGSCVGIPGFIGVPHLISLLSLREVRIQHDLSIKLALSYNLIMMATVPLRMMRVVDRQLFLHLGHHNSWMFWMGLSQSMLTCGLSYGFNRLATQNLWYLSAAQSIALGGVVSAVVGLITTQIYLYQKSKPLIQSKNPELFTGDTGGFSSYGSLDQASSLLSPAVPSPDKEKTNLEQYYLYRLNGLSFFSSLQSVMDSKKGLLIPGAHNALSYLAETLSNLSLIGMMAYLSPRAFIANNIASQSVQLFILLSSGLGMGLQKRFTLENRQNEGGAYLRAAFVLALGVTALSVSAYGLAPWMIACFVNAEDPANQAIVTLAKDLISQYVFFSFGDHLRNIISGANHAAQDTKFMMWATLLCRGVLATGLSAYFGFHSPSYFPPFLQGARGIVSGHLMGVSIGAIAQTARAITHVRRSKTQSTSGSLYAAGLGRPPSADGVSLPGMG